MPAEKSRPEVAMDPLLARYVNLKREMEQRPGATSPAVTPLRPATSGLSGASSMRLFDDPRSVLRSPRVASAPEVSGLSPSLRKRLAQRMEAEASTPAAADMRRAATENELADVRMSLKQQQLEFDDVAGKLDASERQLRHTKDMLEKCEAVRSDLELELAAALREAESAKSGAKSAQFSSAKVMEGKISALQHELDRRDSEVRDWAGRYTDLEQELHIRDTKIADLQSAVNAKERISSDSSITVETMRVEIARLKQALENASVEERMQKGRLERVDDEMRGRELDLERKAVALREEGRATIRKLQTAESELCSVTERLREAESARDRMTKEVNELREASVVTEQLQRDMASKLDALRVRSAQDSIVADESRYDLEQARQSEAKLRHELETIHSRCEELTEEVERLRTEGRAKAALESQHAATLSQLERERDDHDHTRKRAEDHARRIQSLTKDVDSIPALKEKISEMASLIDAKSSAIEKQKQIEKTIGGQLNETQAQCASLREQLNNVSADNQRIDSELTAKNRQIDDLMEEVKQKSALQGEIAGLGTLLRERDQRIAALVTDVQTWQMKSRELDEDVDTLLDVKRQFDELVTNHRALYVQLEQKSSDAESLTRDLEDLTQKLAFRETELNEVNQLLMEREQHVQRQAQQLADKAAVESRLRQVSSELTAVRSELGSEREKREELRAKLLQRDDAIGAERQARLEAEERFNRMQADGAEAQVQVGKLTVRNDSLDKECRRLTHDHDSKLKQIEVMTAELTQLRHETTATGGDLREMRLRESHAVERLHAATGEASRLAQANAALQSHVAELEARVADGVRVSERSKALEGELVRCEQKLTEVARDRDARDHQNNQLIAAAAAQQAEVAALQKAIRRLEEAQAVADRQAEMLEAMERDEAARSKQLMEKEREMSRLRERVSTLTADVDSERTKRKSLEGRVRDLERECERASTLDGQVAGLNLIVQQRSRALEDEKASNAELRTRLARGDHRSVPRSTSAEADTRLAVKDEIIRQLEAEDRRRQQVIEELRHSLARAEDKLDASEAALRDTKAELSSVEAAWAGKCRQLEASAERSRSGDAASLSQVKAELKDATRRAAVAAEELRERDRDFRSLQRQVAAQQTSTDAAARLAHEQHKSLQSSRELLLRSVRGDSHASTERARSPRVRVEDALTQWREQRRRAQAGADASTPPALPPHDDPSVSPARADASLDRLGSPSVRLE